ncbi:hypothetical protein B0H65DRAFT_75460 [Neurospora tetraspora]|uniref:Uncharacterized protein n=1 Tax=Neurospora tetraspora TaxID=94610 RepID=A0AAE0J054_9PEZI|nr:hypothetical protein B0H65DRAFT_75460 [Neurospora tetraspora]
MSHPPHGPGGPSNSSPGTPPGSGGLPSPSFPAPTQSTQQSTTDRTATAHAATSLLSTFPPYAQTDARIALLSAELDALKARQRIWKRLAHAAVLFSSDHELRYSLLDKCNDLAECMKVHPRLREEVGKMNEVELQLFSISSTAKQLVGDVEWVRAEDVRGFVEGVRTQTQGQGEGGRVQVHGNGDGGQGGQGGGVVQVRLDRGRGDVGRRLNYLMVTSQTQGTQGGTQAEGGGGQGGPGGQGGQLMGQGQGQGGQSGQGEVMMGEGSSRRSSTTAAARTTRGQPQTQPQSQVQSYIAAQAVAAAGGHPQSQPQQEETTWSPANASAASSAGRASPGPSEGSSTGPGHGPNRARWWDTVITDSDTDQRRRSESSRNVRGRDAGSDCEMEI